jgi:hypothetical protein
MWMSLSVTVMLKGMFFDSWAIIQQNLIAGKHVIKNNMYKDIAHSL